MSPPAPPRVPPRRARAVRPPALPPRPGGSSTGPPGVACSSVRAMTAADTASRAAALRDLHLAPELLQVVNVWDVVSARAVASLPGTRALATASHSIAASFGYEDGENIPVELMLDMCGRIAAAVDAPVTADLEAGYGDVHATIRRAIGLGIVGANLEDGVPDGLRPLAQAVHAVEAAVSAGEDEGVPFVLNARTDVFLRPGEPAEQLAAAVERGRAYVDAGATCVFVPGRLTAEQVAELVAGIGDRRISVFGYPGAVPPAELEALGVARLSYGPQPQRVALAALQGLGTDLLGGAGFPEGVPVLN
jgi:2-methylisocitrate lyase-like PEP mutase family enzyme